MQEDQPTDNEDITLLEAERMLFLQNSIKNIHSKNPHLKFDPTDYYSELSTMTNDQLENVLFNLNRQIATKENLSVIQNGLALFADAVSTVYEDPTLKSDICNDLELQEILCSELTARGINFPRVTRIITKLYAIFSKRQNRVGEKSTSRNSETIQRIKEQNKPAANISS